MSQLLDPPDRPAPAGRSAPEGGRARLSADERRQQLFEIALQLFADRGFAATTMEEIADAAGVTKPLVYQHFDSKRALYLELMGSVATDVIAAVSAATAAAETPRQQVELGMGAFCAQVARNEAAFLLLWGRDAPHDPEFSAPLERVESTMVHTIDALIDADLDPVQRRTLAAGVVGLAEGIARAWIDEQPGRDAAGEHVAPPLDAEGAAVVAAWMADLIWSGLRQVRRLPSPG